MDESKQPEDILVLIKGPTPTPMEDSIVKSIHQRGYHASVLPWTKNFVPAVSEKRCISLVELDTPIMDELCNSNFSRLVDLVKNALHITWVVGVDEEKPQAAMIAGMFRVLHNEMPGLEPIAISVDAVSRREPINLAAVIARIFSKAEGERELQIIGGVPHICRFIPNNKLNTTIDKMTQPKDAQDTELMSLAEASARSKRLKLAIGKPGQLDSTYFELDGHENTLQLDEIEIDVKASALNFRDVMSIMDMIPNPTLGIEAAGTVRRVGSAVCHLQLGDRVALIGNDAHASIMRDKAHHAFKIPAAMTFSQAASLPTVSYTAWYALVNIAKCCKGESILIHAGAGGVGQAALQLANAKGLEIFTTVSSQEKRQLVQEKYGVKDDHIFDSRNLLFARQIMKKTSNRGVDIILNSLAGEALRQSWECLAPSGRFVEIGLKDIVDDTRLGMRPFFRGASFTSLNLKDLWDSQQDLMRSIVDGTEPYLSQGLIKPAQSLNILPVSDIVKGLRLLQSGKHMGKIVLEWEASSQLPVLRTSLLQPKQNDGAVLLVGGMGGLGRSIARMLVLRGARKLCFMSRSAGTSAEAQHLLNELAEQGVHTRVITCDISDHDSLNGGINQCTKEFGAIQGVFQCAAVLRDALFTKMTYSEWTGSTLSKVQGSRNLHNALPDVDFFVMLSSFAGIFGNRGQTNYAAGCAFQDALAQSRRARGLAAVSIDLGVMRDVGNLAENGATGDIKNWEKVWGIREDKFLALMQLAMQPDNMSIEASVVTGLGTRAGTVAAGIKPPFYFDSDRRFDVLSHLGEAKGLENSADDDEQPLSSQLQQAQDVQQAVSHVLSALVHRVAKMLDMPASDLGPGRFLHSYGVDSLAAIEIVNWALREAQARIAVFDVMAAVPMSVFSERVVAKSGLVKP